MAVPGEKMQRAGGLRMVYRQRRIIRNISDTRHTLVNETKIIEKLAVTPANIPYSQIDLSIPGIIYYRDRDIS